MAYRELFHPELGLLRISMRRNATRISARFHNGKVLVIVPPDVDGDILYRAIEEMKPGLLAHVPPVKFEIGQSILTDGGPTFHIERHAPLGPMLRIVRCPDGAVVRIGDRVDLSSPDVPGRISRLLIHGAYCFAPDVLLPRAREIAASLGLSPASWSISRGHKVLGHCSADGNIALSAIGIFLPRELRDYIVCHELAHLTEMNHSPRFHRLCDSYLGGREAELSRRLNTFVWPILR